jgi:hypothetical protein
LRLLTIRVVIALSRSRKYANNVTISVLRDPKALPAELEAYYAALLCLD